jgi:hypothetical protein
MSTVVELGGNEGHDIFPVSGTWILDDVVMFL